MHQCRMRLGPPLVAGLPSLVDGPDLGALIAAVVLEAPVAADKQQRAGTAEGAAKLACSLGSVHEEWCIKPAASPHA